ncbi:MAG TPA: ImmA/IrrE family metallo-endopeptidase [Beijerinckiaceae bacterium]|jgi:plasmid maintenance system antidote protein VapI/Zn-dependent peptidase ImmA (M78 family)
MRERATNLPEWISPPGEIVGRILSSREMELDEFASNVGLSVRDARGLIEGTTAIDDNLAVRLAAVVGSTPSFWLRCEQSYREDMQRNLPAYVDDQVKDWLRRMPLKEMSDLGWVKRHRNPIRQAEECFRFFGIIGLDNWKTQQTDLLASANFRTSEAFSSDPTATSAWLRWAENKAEDIACRPWNRDAFSNGLNTVRALSRNHHPERFVPRLREICAASGVAVVIGPAPAGCRASGATKMVRRRKAMIVLSFRYYSDDHFWFTFFHEAGHLLKHAEQGLFLEGENGEVDDIEREANAFALDILIPAEKQRTMLSLPPRHEAVIAFARQIGIAPGIVVGQMQRLGHLPYGWLNRLKRRFNWKALYKNGIIP